MTQNANPDRMHVTIHLIDFDAADLWPLHGAYSRFGSDLDSFAEEVTRRLSSDGYLGFRPNPTSISIIPFDAVKRVDFTVRP